MQAKQEKEHYAAKVNFTPTDSKSSKKVTISNKQYRTKIKNDPTACHNQHHFNRQKNHYKCVYKS